MDIAGTWTDKDWLKRKGELVAAGSPALWDKTFDEFLMERINTRYLDPIEAISALQRNRGEGFSIVALFCTLIEFLEGCETGMNFDPNANPGDPHKYGLKKGVKRGSELFEAFLVREPFNTLLGAHRSTFYSAVRCGLLHEARTCAGWKIRTNGPSGQLVEYRSPDIILYRDQLKSALEKYLRGYRMRLSQNPEAQANFIIKWDHLCT